MSKSFAPEVIADETGKWYGNALRFTTREEAEQNVSALRDRLYIVTDTRVVESDDEPNWRFVNGKLYEGAGPDATPIDVIDNNERMEFNRK